MENAITPNSLTTSSSIGSTKRFRFDSFAMEFACKEKDISPVSTTQSLSSSSHSIQTTDNENMDNDSGIGKLFINHFSYYFSILNQQLYVFDIF